MKGAPQKAEGEAGREEHGVVWVKGCKGKPSGGKRAAAPRREAGGGCGGFGAGGGGEVWAGDGEEREEKNKRAVKRQRLLRGEGRPRVGARFGVAPGGPGQSQFRGAVGGRGRCAWEAVQGAPSEPHHSTPPIYSILDSHRRQQEEEVGRKR